MREKLKYITASKKMNCRTIAILLTSLVLLSCNEGTDPASNAPYPLSRLNDTGIISGGNYPSGNNISCIGETVVQQDCTRGRDVTHNDNSDGHAGFSYTKLDTNGNSLSASASTWSCVKDNVTGKIWEVKQGGNNIVGDEGLHDADDGYNWYNTDPINNAGGDGYANNSGAVCYGYDASSSASYCNTQAYVSRVNAEGLCGTNDWRMPTRSEFRNLVNLNRANPSIDTDYFPATISFNYWTASPSTFGGFMAGVFDFRNGAFGQSIRYYPFHVRLVRDGQ